MAAITEQEREKGFAMFAEGKSTNEVANALFKGAWAKAKKLREEWGGADGAADAKARPVRKKRVPAARDEPDAESAPETWDVMLQLPAERMAGIFAAFSAQEKANAIAAVLQGRLAEE